MSTRTYIRDGAEIYRRSFAIIRAEADLKRFNKAEERIAVRIIHACGMVEIARDIVMSNGFADNARWALIGGAPILCDSKMVANGITRARLEPEPKFAQIAAELIEFLRGAELIIHNAAFDIGFLDAEFARLPGVPVTVASLCTVVDSWALARQMHPGQRNSLDALCKRYNVDNTGRQLHGALLDAQLLGEVYLAMTGGQVALRLGESGSAQNRDDGYAARPLTRPATALRVVLATAEEELAHQAFLALLAKSSKGRCLWQTLEAPNS